MDREQFRQASRKVWDQMAGGWDEHREYLWEASQPVAEWLVEKLAPSPGQTVLELAAGMGDTGFIAAQMVGDGGRLISTDFAPSMVEGARRRARELGISNGEFRVMDAEEMDLEPGSVDGVLCRWGFMLMGDPGAALREAHRVLRPGGRLCFSVFSTADKNPWAALPARVLIENGFMEPPAPGSPGILALADPSRLRALLQEAGFSEPTIEEVPIVWRHRDFEGYWEFLTRIAGAIATLLEGLPPEKRKIARDGMERAVARFRRGESIVLPGVTLNVAAAKDGLPGSAAE